jgi:RNA-directed DNA polymerase
MMKNHHSKYGKQIKRKSVVRRAGTIFLIYVGMLYMCGGFRGVHVGGNLNNGVNSGLAYFNCNNSPSNRNANIGSHQFLLKSFLIEPYNTTMPLGKKEKTSINSNVSSNKRTLCRLQEKQNMKRNNNLFEQICSIENIEKAFKNAKKGKSHYGEVKKINKNTSQYFNELHQILISGNFKNSKYQVITKKTGGKIRDLYKLPFYPDRIAHHCIVQILAPIWTSLFIRDTYATIPNRGVHDGVKRVKKALKNDPKNTQYCLKIDVRKYYPNVNHEILKNILERKIKCDKTIDLLSLIIDSAPGIPIGNYISQWFGNVYLAYFDHYVKEQLLVNYYFRYADDMVFLSDKKEFLHNILQDVSRYLSEQLKLEVKPDYQIFPVAARGIDFLGYRFFHNYTLVRKSIVQTFKNKTGNHKSTPQNQPSYWGWFKHANTFNLQKKYFDMNKFGEFAEKTHTLKGKKIGIQEVLNKEIIITDFRIMKSKYEKENYTQIQLKIPGNDEDKVVFTGATVLADQLEKYKDKIPFIATIVKPHKYYTFS